MVTKPLNPRTLEDAPDSIPVAPDPFAGGPPAPVTGGGRMRPAWKVTFYVTSPSQGVITLDVWRVTVLGRADPMSAFRPDLDYGPYGAMRCGVSRRHALLRPTEDALSIIDQHSTNGTWVNGQRLTPGQGFPLTDGDVIELGGLRMILRIDDAPGKAPEAPSEPQRKMKGFGFRFLGRS